MVNVKLPESAKACCCCVWKPYQLSQQCFHFAFVLTWNFPNRLASDIHTTTLSDITINIMIAIIMMITTTIIIIIIIIIIPPPPHHPHLHPHPPSINPHFKKCHLSNDPSEPRLEPAFQRNFANSSDAGRNICELQVLGRRQITSGDPLPPPNSCYDVIWPNGLANISPT